MVERQPEKDKPEQAGSNMREPRDTKAKRKKRGQSHSKKIHRRFNADDLAMKGYFLNDSLGRQTH